MTACGRKSAFRLQAKYKICKATSSALFTFCSGEEWSVVGGGEPLPLLVLKALGNWSPETFTQYFRNFQWSGHCPFFSAMSHSRKEVRALGDSSPGCPKEVGWIALTVAWGGAQERLGDCSLYNSSRPVYTGNYSEKTVVVVQIHTQHKYALTFKFERTLMFYYLCKGDNWCEISKEN